MLYHYTDERWKRIGHIEPDYSSGYTVVLSADFTGPTPPGWRYFEDKNNYVCFCRDSFNTAIVHLLKMANPDLDMVYAAMSAALAAGAKRNANDIARHHGIPVCELCGFVSPDILNSRPGKLCRACKRGLQRYA